MLELDQNRTDLEDFTPQAKNKFETLCNAYASKLLEETVRLTPAAEKGSKSEVISAHVEDAAIYLDRFKSERNKTYIDLNIGFRILVSITAVASPILFSIIMFFFDKDQNLGEQSTLSIAAAFALLFTIISHTTLVLANAKLKK
jgi:hypothetical protein